MLLNILQYILLSSTAKSYLILSVSSSTCVPCVHCVKAALSPSADQGQLPFPVWQLLSLAGSWWRAVACSSKGTCHVPLGTRTSYLAEFRVAGTGSTNWVMGETANGPLLLPCFGSQTQVTFSGLAYWWSVGCLHSSLTLQLSCPIS